MRGASQTPAPLLLLSARLWEPPRDLLKRGCSTGVPLRIGLSGRLPQIAGARGEGCSHIIVLMTLSHCPVSGWTRTLLSPCDARRPPASRPERVPSVTLVRALAPADLATPNLPGWKRENASLAAALSRSSQCREFENGDAQ